MKSPSLLVDAVVVVVVVVLVVCLFGVVLVVVLALVVMFPVRLVVDIMGPGLLKVSTSVKLASAAMIHHH